MAWARCMQVKFVSVCGARYKTRPGLTYHYTHSHKDEEGGCADPATASTAVAATSDPFVKQQPQQMTPQGASPSALEPGWHTIQDHYLIS